MERLLVHPRHRALLERLRLVTCDAIVRRFGVAIPPGGVSAVVPAALGEKDEPQPVAVFYKQYEYAKPSWRFLWRDSKAAREFRSYEVFAKLGVACAEPVACGEVRDALGRLQRAFIITALVPGASRLDHFLDRRCADRSSSRPMRLAILNELARMTRRLHDGGFFHNDLHWRNVLVTLQGGEPQLTLIDCPRGRFERVPMLRERRAIKDLATLDRTAMNFCSAAERMMFVRAYLGPGASRKKAQSLARAVMSYGARRWGRSSLSPEP